MFNRMEFECPFIRITSACSARRGRMCLRSRSWIYLTSFDAGDNGAGRGDKVQYIHIGGAYGDKAIAGERFIRQFSALSPRFKHRVTLENDDNTLRSMQGRRSRQRSRREFLWCSTFIIMPLIWETSVRTICTIICGPKLIEDLKRMEACGEGVTVLDGGRVEIAPHNQH
ncbi:hypothetical protein ASG81_28805 [Paenibacillus sp. Soil522]|nr:hypothetical protein ASG81_28805 [Paenibacillus sp. Soil522]